MLTKFLIIAMTLGQTSAFVNGPFGTSRSLPLSPKTPIIRYDTKLEMVSPADEIDMQAYLMRLGFATDQKVAKVFRYLTGQKQKIDSLIKAKNFDELWEMSSLNHYYVDFAPLKSALPKNHWRDWSVDGDKKLAKYALKQFFDLCVQEENIPKLVEHTIFVPRGGESIRWTSEAFRKLINSGKVSTAVVAGANTLCDLNTRSKEEVLASLESQELKDILKTLHKKGLVVRQLQLHNIPLFGEGDDYVDLPRGGWLQRSVLLNWDGKTLTANCLKDDGTKNVSTLIVPHRWGRVENNDGSLVFVEDMKIVKEFLEEYFSNLKKEKLKFLENLLSINPDDVQNSFE